MPKHLYLLMMLTSVVGFVGGALLFIETRSEAQESAVLPSAPRIVDGFEIIAYRYGGCARLGCPSYRITDDGTYTYLTRGRDGLDRRFSDSLSVGRLNELRTILYAADLESVIEASPSTSCPASYDGIAYRYEIRRDNERYSIDSCREDTSSERLFVMLSDFFEIFSVTYRNE